MKVTPPKKLTFLISVTLWLLAIILGLFKGFAWSTYFALAGLALLIAGNLFDRL